MRVVGHVSAYDGRLNPETASLGGCLRGRVRVAHVVDEDVTAAAREFEHDRPTDTAAAACYQRELAAQTHCVSVPLTLSSTLPFKAVEIGQGVQIAYDRGSQAHDEIAYDAQNRRFYHLSNRAGGIEGGITNGEEVRVVGYLKPIPTLKKALRSVDMISKEPFLAQHERSDTCTVPAAGVIGESMMALVLAGAFLEKFAGDSVDETKRNYEGYLQQLRDYPGDK